MKALIIALIAVCLSVTCFAFSKKPAAEEVVAFETIITGQHSSIDTAAAFLIGNEADWLKIWKLAQGRIEPMPEAPKFDFNEYTILAIFMGEKTSGGHKIEITDIVKSGSDLKVAASRYSGGGGSMLPVLTSPYHIVKIPYGEYKIQINYTDLKEH